MDFHIKGNFNQLVGGIQQAVASVGNGLSYTGRQISLIGYNTKEGVLNAASSVSVIFSHLNTVEGLIPLVKTVPADIRLLNRFDIKYFNGAYEEFEALKDLLYAFVFISTIRESFIKEVPVLDEDGNQVLEEGKLKTKHTFSLPHYIKNGVDKGVDMIKVYNLIGDVCETIFWVKKVNLIQSYPFFTNLSSNYGYVKVFPWINGEKLSIDDVPVLQTANKKFKDFWVFLASTSTLIFRWDDLKGSWEGWCKIASSIGKDVLIVFGRIWGPNKEWLGTTFAFIDFATQNVSVASFIIKKEVLRLKRFNDPIV